MHTCTTLCGSKMPITHAFIELFFSLGDANFTALGVVYELDSDLLLLPDGLADLIDSGHVCLRPLKKSADIRIASLLITRSKPKQ